MDKYLGACRTENQNNLTAANLFAGGGLCTMGEARAGFDPIWSAECVGEKQIMLEDLSHSRCYHDAFGEEVLDAPSPNLLWVTAPCQDFALSGTLTGCCGDSGWMFGASASVILCISPDSFIIEQSGNTPNVNSGQELWNLLEELSSEYDIAADVKKLWRWGDPTNRERLFVVGFHKRLGADKNTVKGRGKFFAWPDPVYNPGEAPVYADIAVPDSEVPYEYIRSDSVPLCEYKEPEPGKLHLIGQIGDKGNMGYSLNPAPTYSFLSLPNGQTRHNGGGRRPMQEWQQGDPLTQTRLTVPVETVRMANCPEGYGPYCKSFNPEQSDVWLRDCVNQGVPLHTGYLLSQAVYTKLEELGATRRGSKVAPLTEPYKGVQQANSASVMCTPMLVDTGCFPTGMVSTKYNAMLNNPEQSGACIEIANGELLDAGLRGRLEATVSNPDKVPDCDPEFKLGFTVTTCDHSQQELFSVDEAYKEGWKTVLDPNSYSYMSKIIEGKTVRLPFRRGVKGGWFLDLIILSPPSEEQEGLQRRRRNQALRAEMFYAETLDTEDIAESLTKGQGLPVSTPGTVGAIVLSYAFHPNVRHTVHIDEDCPLDVDDPDTDMKAFSTYTDECITLSNADPATETKDPIPGSELEPGSGLAARTRSGGNKGDAIASVLDDDTPEKPDDTEGSSDPAEECVSCDESRDDVDPKKQGDSANVINPVKREYTLCHKGQRRFRPVKKNLRFGKAKEPYHRSHCDHGHMGMSKGCKICSMVMGCARRMYQLVDPHREDRRGHTWVMDGITFDESSNEGSLYLVVLRDIATDMVKTFPIATKDQIVGELEEWIKSIRNDQDFKGLTYKPVALIKTDMAGEWAPDSGEFKLMLQRVREATGADVKVKYASPCDPKKRRAGLAERTNGIVEAMCKSILMEQSLPPSWWEAAVRDVEFLINRTPTYRNTLNLSETGDQSSPIERFTNEGYSRDQVYTDLSYFIQVGTPCLVHDKQVKGSTLAPKASWWVSYGMVGGNPKFKDPLTHTTRYSKSYTSFKLRDGLSFSQFLGLGNIPSTRKSILRKRARYKDPKHKDEDYVVNLSEFYKKYAKEVPPVDPAVTDFTQHGKHDSIPKVTRTSAPGLRGTAPKVKQPGAAMQEPKPAPIGKGLRPPGEDPEEDDEEKLEAPSPPSKVRLEDESNANNEVLGGTEEQWAAVDAAAEKKLQEQAARREAAEAKKVLHKGKMTGAADKFESFARTQLKIPNDQVTTYLEWLVTHPQLTLRREDGLVMGLRNVTRLPPNIFLPYPSGPRYREMLEAAKEGSKLKHIYTSKAELLDSEILRDEAFISAMQCKMLGMSRERKQWRCDADVPFYLCAGITEESMLAHQAHQKKPVRKKVRRKAVAAGEEAPPNTTRQALSHPTRSLDWMRSLDKEFFGLVNLGVLKLGYTLKELQEMGITSAPVPIGTVFDHKYDTLTGILKTLKSRMALKGHPGNMFKDVHYTETYAATPVGDTERVLQAAMVRLRLKRRAFDIKQAYCHAGMEKGYEQIILTYPEGYQEWDGEEPLYILMDKNLYGHPAGARNWTICRDEFINEYFNKGEWVCHHCVDTDPCLFHIKRLAEPRQTATCDTCGTTVPPKDEVVVDEMWVLIHTDDCDLYGTTDDILASFEKVIDDKWGIKSVNPEEQLGVKRVISYPEGADGPMEVRVTMPVFVEGMAATFADDPYYPSNKDMTTPYPVDMLPDVRVNKEEVSEDEAKGVIKRGYQRAVGMIMWAARHCFPECQLAASFASRNLSHPSLRDWKAVLHTIKWMWQHKNRGIIFSGKSPYWFRVFVDASNNPDSRSLCQSGHVAYMMGGPVRWESQRNSHPDIAAPRNEYMAMLGACGTVNWVRTLLADAGLPLAEGPTNVYTDSKTACQMIDKNKITRSYKYVRAHFHIVREFSRDGIISVQHIFGKYNPADLTTKSNPRQRIQGDNGEAGVLELCGFRPINLDGCEPVERYGESEKDSGYE